MKRILILFLMCICIDIQAQDVIKHVVKRGETLSSIAKTYGTTEDRIKRLNKNVSNFLYAGMELTIEQGYSKASPQESDINIRNFMTISEQEDQIKKVDEDDKAYDGLSLSMEIGFGFLEHGTTYNSAHAFETSIGVNYFMSNLYCGARIGYLGGNYYSSEVDYKANLLALPTEVGYVLGNRSFAIIPFGGFNFNFGLNAKAKIKDYGTQKSNIGYLGMSFRFGLRIRISDYDITAYYSFPLNDEQKYILSNKPYLGISLGFGF